MIEKTFFAHLFLHLLAAHIKSKEADQASFDYSYREISLELVYIIVET